MRHLIKYLFVALLMTGAHAYTQNNYKQLEDRLAKASGAEKAGILNEMSGLAMETDLTLAEKHAKEAAEIASKSNSAIQEGLALHTLGRISLFQGDQTKSITYFHKAYRLRNSIKDWKGVNQTAINIGTYYANIGKNDEALGYYEEAIHAAAESGHERGEGIAYNQIGNIYNRTGRYENAIKYYQEAIRIFEKIGFFDGVASCCNNIGSIYSNLNKKDDALRYFLLSLSYYNETGNILGMGEASNNLGTFYGLGKDVTQKEPHNADSAVYYFDRALGYFKTANHTLGMVSVQVNTGLIYMYSGNFDKALENLNSALELNKNIGSKYEYSSIYKGIGLVYHRKKMYAQALHYFYMGLRLAEEIENMEHQMMNFKHIAESNDSLANYREALNYLWKYLNLNDELHGEKITKITQELETKYETEKKEQMIREANQRNDYQQKIIWGAAIGGSMILIFAVLMMIQFIQKKRANTLLVEKNEEILLQKEEIEAQRDEIEAQKDQVEAQRDLIEDQQRGIMDSIHYASRIQQAILPQPESIQDIVPGSFVLFKPRDIVSGDFYWLGQKGSKNIVVAADCTGHGVPGAFMSMLGTAFLNEIIGAAADKNCSQILNELRNYVINSLRQTGKQGEQKDGMDLAIYQLDRNNLKLQFAGANNPLYIIRQAGSAPREDKIRVTYEEYTNEHNSKNYEVITLKADKMPIGIYADSRPFEDVEMQIHPGDSIYTFSDGYVDQFGGPKGKKYLTKRFKQLLANSQHLGYDQQKNLLDAEFASWKANYEQIDDIIVIGVCI
jgi:serine phosphatase RsbU (regulator of sigma subunit)/Tfp pilus assembly protein PilF